MEDILHRLGKLDLTDYGPIPFWSWNNRLEKEKLLEQIADMKKVGCGGFIMHARTGLTTEYLSEEWFSLIEACLDEAKRLRMNAWIYDENGWPSGFVGGKLLDEEENLACELILEEKDSFDEKAFAVFEKTDAGLRRIKSGAPADGIYHTVYMRRSPSNTDILNPAVVEKFIAATHEEYYRRFKDRFGKELTGFFTDEPQYFRWGTPYTPAVAEFWRKEYGEDIADGIIHLFYDDEEDFPFRVRYYKALNTLYTENFYKRLYDWCEEHGCKLTGHSVEESSFTAQMLGGAGCTPSYEYEHIPAIDNLAVLGGAKLSARQVGSAAGQLGKKQVLTETFGCSGYGISPKELKAIAEKQYVHGVNMMCHHLYAYSLAGQGKTDHPPCFSKHMTWWEEFPTFNAYFTRLGYLLAETDTCVNCAVISPMTSVYLRYKRFDESKAAEVDRAFGELQTKLNAEGILYDMVDEKILSEYGEVSDGRLKVGRRTYDYVIVPCCDNFCASTKSALSAYVADGGKLLSEGTPSYTEGKRDDWSFLDEANPVTLSDIAAGGKIRLKTDGKAEYTYRQGKDFEFLYIVNVEREEARVSVPEKFDRVDLLTLKRYVCDRDIVLGGGESILLMPSEKKGKAEPASCFAKPSEITDAFRFVGSDANNLTLDTVRISFDGERYGEEEPLAEAFDRLLRAKYEGRLFVKYSFYVGGRVENISLRREKGKYLSTQVNGKVVSFEESGFDFNFEEADITAAIKIGKNEYVNELNFYERPHVFWALYAPEATESVRNCLWYDTEIENVYLLGDFTVDQARRIQPFAPPAGTSSLEKNGFSHFAGRMRFAADVFGKSDSARLTVNGAYTAVEAYVNGKRVGECLFSENIVVPLKKGAVNRVELVAVSSLRNMFGPFHFNGDEGWGVSPFSFTMRGSWQNGKSEHYTSEYKVVPFGIDSVTIAYGI